MVVPSQSLPEKGKAVTNALPLVYMYLQFAWDCVLLGLFTVRILVGKSINFFVPRRSKSLKNEIILVTGGANGIGREICRQLVKMELCLTIISWDIDEKHNETLVKELQALGVKGAYGFKVDVSDRDQVKAGVISIRQQIGDVTMLFNNAGIAGETGEGWRMNPRSIERVLQVNLLSHCWTIRELLPTMIAKKKGHIVETCSILGFAWGKFGSSYIASKHGLKAYVESIKEDIRSLPEKCNVSFTMAYPHNTLTAMTAKVNLVARKYPFLLPKLTPGHVASKIIEGVLQNEEHVFVPSYCRYMVMILALLPSEVLRQITDLPCVEKGENAVEEDYWDADSDSGNSVDSSPSLD